MRVIQSPARLDIHADERAVFLAGSIDMGSSRDWQGELAVRLASCEGVLLNPRRAAWDSQWPQQASFPPFKEQVDWELTAMEAAGMIAFHFVPGSQAPITLLELGPSPHFSQGGSTCRGKVMISKCFELIYKVELAVHAEPIAALAALKLASLALQSTHSPRYGFPSRAARDDLDSTHRSRSL